MPADDDGTWPRPTGFKGDGECVLIGRRSCRLIDWRGMSLVPPPPPPVAVVNVYSYVPRRTPSPTGEYSYFSRSRKDRHKEPVCLIPNDGRVHAPAADVLVRA